MMKRLLVFGASIWFGLLALIMAPVAAVGEGVGVAFPGAEGFGGGSIGGRGGR